MVTPASTLNPPSGEIIASTEPDFNLSISPIASAGTLYNPPPSPLYIDADISPVDVRLPSIFVATFTSNEVPLETDAVAEPLAIRITSPISDVV